MQCFLISIHFFLVCKLVQHFYSSSHNLFLHFLPCLCLSYLEKVFHLVYKKEEAKRNNCAVVFCYVLNFYFYIFENLIDIIIFLDILLSLIGALFKYLFLSCFTSLKYLFLVNSIIATTFYNIFYNNNFTLSKCCFDNINIYINTSVRSLCLANVFIFDQKETISVSSTPSSSITSYNLVIFYFIEAILSIVFYKQYNFNITKQFSIFNISFSLF